LIGDYIAIRADDDFFRGDWRSAETHATQALALGFEHGYVHVLCAARLVLGAVALGRGNLQAAAEYLDQKEDAYAAGSLYIQRRIWRVRAELDLASGQPEQAVARLEPIVAEAEAPDLAITLLLPVLAEALLASGDTGRALTLAVDAVRSAELQKNTIALADAARVQAMALAQCGEWDEARHIFTRDLEMTRRTGYPLAEGRCLQAWGVAELRSGDVAAGQRHLANAEAVFRRLVVDRPQTPTHTPA
jgi:tetratricopeptide (TPR) repeat protein